GAVVALVLALGLLPLVASPAGAAATTLQGTVTVAGVGRSGILVQLLNPVWGNTFASATTGAGGSYSLGVVPSDYKIRFRDPSGTLADVYSSGATTLATAPVVTLAAGTTTTIDAAMVTGGAITGTIT